MNKDVIYIDVEDDVTAIIGKIKASKEKIIALVPPKRVGVLQSAVNLRLLDRMASSSNKHLVVITNNQALIALSAAAGIPVAKNLQSKPEIAEITALNIDDDEDIIDGSSLPIGELERTTDHPKANAVDEAIDELDIDDKRVDMASGMGAVAITQSKKSKSGIKVPNFNSFRKRLFLGIAAFVALVIFLIWANVYAPGATVIITAKTVAAPISQTVSLGTTATNVATNTIQAVTQTLKKDVSVKFTPTGQQDLGAKATGTMTLTNTTLSSNKIDVPAGTTFTSSDGHVFTSNADVTLKGTYLSGSGPVYDTEQDSVTAAAPGPDYNQSSGQYYQPDVSGFSAKGSAMVGGTSNIQTVVSASDIAAATTALNALPTTADEAALTAQFKNGESVIKDTFNAAARSTPVSSPAVGAQASGQATLTSTVTYTISALAQPDIKMFLDASLKQQLNGSTDQRVYDDGISKVILAGYNNSAGTPTINIASTGQVGPNIDINAVKAQIKGKKSGEVQSLLSNITGVSDVTVNFSYPWVTTIPNDVNKVDVQFKLTNG